MAALMKTLASEVRGGADSVEVYDLAHDSMAHDSMNDDWASPPARVISSPRTERFTHS